MLDDNTLIYLGMMKWTREGGMDDGWFLLCCCWICVGLDCQRQANGGEERNQAGEEE